MFKTVVTGIIISSSLASAAPAPKNDFREMRCEFVFTSTDVSRSLAPEFVASLKKSHNTLVEVTDQAPIQNQGNRGFCHMYSMYAEFVREYKARNKGEDPNISIHYWTYFHWLPLAIETAINPKSALEIPEGSWYELTFDVLKKAGVMTKEQWDQIGGRTDIELREKNAIELGQLKTVVSNAHFEKQLLTLVLKPELEKGQTRSKYFTKVFENPQVPLQLQQFAQRKSKELAKGETRFTAEQIQIILDISKGRLRDRELSPSAVDAIFSAMNRDITRDVERQFNFIYFGQAKSPLPPNQVEQRALAAKMLPEMLQKTVSFTFDGARAGKMEYIERKMDHLFFSAPLPNIIGMIKLEIDKNNSVWLGYDHDDYFVDMKTGNMTIAGMNTEPMNPHIRQFQRSATELYYGGHAVQIVGYEKNEKGEIVAFKIQNSWSKKAGKNGYFRMSMDYFRAYVMRITVRDEDNEFTDDVIAQLEAEKRQRKIEQELRK